MSFGSLIMAESGNKAEEPAYFGDLGKGPPTPIEPGRPVSRLGINSNSTEQGDAEIDFLDLFREVCREVKACKSFADLNASGHLEKAQPYCLKVGTGKCGSGQSSLAQTMKQDVCSRVHHQPKLIGERGPTAGSIRS